MFGLSLGMVLSVCTCWFPYLNVLYLLILVHAHTGVPYLILPLFPCVLRYSVAFYRVALYVCCSENTGHADVMWSVFSSFAVSGFSVFVA